MERKGMISSGTNSTEWVNAMVITEKNINQ